MEIKFQQLKLIFRDLSHLSVVILIAANMVPLYGVIFLGWQVFPLLFLYWFENVIIGVYNVLKMLVCKPSDHATTLCKIAAIPFFCVHYGLFTLAHGIFVFVLFGGFLNDDSFAADGANVLQTLWSNNIGWAALDFFVSHGISFAVNFIKGSEYKRASLIALMQAPYGRVVIMHLTIMGGGFLMMVLQSPVAGLIMLVLIKIVLDVRGHTHEHFKPKPEEIVIATKA